MFQANPAEAEATGDQMSWNVTPTSRVLVVVSASPAPPGASDAQPAADEDTKGHTDDGTEAGDAGGAGRPGTTRQLRRVRW
jgi:hypothetical protein